MGGLAYLFGVYCFGLNWTWSFGLVLALLGVALFVLSQKINLKEGVILASIVSCMFIGGMLYHSLRININEQNNSFIINQEVALSGVVSSEPRFSEKSQQFNFELQNPEKGSLNIITTLIPEFQYGDKLEIKGRVVEQLLAQGVPGYSLIFPEINIFGHQNSIRSYLVQFKSTLISNIKKYLPRDEASLLSGLTLGARSDFSSNLKDQMAKSGTTHIVALSGYNIAILILAVNGILSSFVSRKKLIWLMALIILFFTIMVGGEASVVRAAIMASILLLARHSGRRSDVLNAIILTAVFMVLYDPTIINFNLGFQLSFLSLLGIIYLTSWVENLIFKKQKIETEQKGSFWGWKENLVTTIAAQLAVAPIIIQNFHQFSLGSVIANILILSTVPLAMFLGFAVAFFGSILSALGFILAKITSILLIYQIFIIKIFSYTSIEVNGKIVGGIFILLYYSILILLVKTKTDSIFLKSRKM